MANHQGVDMANEAEYEDLGDPDVPVEATKKDLARQAEAEQMTPRFSDLPGLTYDEMVSGAPCPGCGLPWVDPDAEPWHSKGTIHMTDAERERYEAEEARFKAQHGNCHGVRMGSHGIITTHCGQRCPMPPMSPERVEDLAQVFASLPPPRPTDLVRWKLRLICGHVVEHTAHRDKRTVAGHVACSECGKNPAVILAARTGRGAPVSASG
jgi:hypothetical protein